MGARLADIAAQAGVSEATVSRVLNGKPGVAEGTRQAVLTALDVLGYERPAKLRQHSAGLVGLIVPELENPIFPAFAQVIESALARQGYTPVLCTQTPGGVHEDEYTRMLLERGVAGIVFVSGLHADVTADPARYQALRRRGLPIVLVNGYMEGIDAPFISNDDVASMELSVGHLVELGHTRIGLAVGPRRFTPALRKIAGFREAMRRRLGLEDVEQWIESTLFSVEGGGAAAEALLERGATAVICGSDLMALGAVRAVRTRGCRCPATPPSWGTTTRCSSRSPTRRSPRCASRCRRWGRRRSGPCSTRSPERPRRVPSSCSGPNSSCGGRRGRHRGGRRPAPYLITTSRGSRSRDLWLPSRDPPRPSRVRPASRRCRAMRINDVLRRKGDLVVTIQPQDTVRALLDALAEHKVGALVVSGAGGAVEGIVSERDVVRHLQARGAGVLDELVSTIMTSPVHTAAPETTLDELMVLMTERRIRHVPVVVDERLTGIVSIGDVVKHRIEELQSERDQLTAYIQQ